MKLDAYESIIKQVSNPDTLAEGLVNLREQLKTDEANYNNLLNSNNTLRDTNAKLALRITNDVSIKNEPELSREEKSAEFMKKFYV